MGIIGGAVAVPVLGPEYWLLPSLILPKGSEIRISRLFIASCLETDIQKIVHTGKYSHEVIPDPPGFPSNEVHQKIIIKLLLLQELSRRFLVVVIKRKTVCIGSKISRSGQGGNVQEGMGKIIGAGGNKPVFRIPVFKTQLKSPLRASRQVVVL